MRVRIVVNVRPAAVPRIDRIARALVRAGMTVDQILSASGIITGTADDTAVAALGGVAGVASVEPDVDLPLPPDDQP